MSLIVNHLSLLHPLLVGKNASRADEHVALHHAPVNNRTRAHVRDVVPVDVRHLRMPVEHDALNRHTLAKHHARSHDAVLDHAAVRHDHAVADERAVALALAREPRRRQRPRDGENRILGDVDEIRGSRVHLAEEVRGADGDVALVPLAQVADGLPEPAVLVRVDLVVGGDGHGQDIAAKVQLRALVDVLNHLHELLHRAPGEDVHPHVHVHVAVVE